MTGRLVQRIIQIELGYYNANAMKVMQNEYEVSGASVIVSRCCCLVIELLIESMMVLASQILCRWLRQLDDHCHLLLGFARVNTIDIPDRSCHFLVPYLAARPAAKIVCYSLYCGMMNHYFDFDWIHLLGIHRLRVGCVGSP